MGGSSEDGDAETGKSVTCRAKIACISDIFMLVYPGVVTSSSRKGLRREEEEEEEECINT